MMTMNIDACKLQTQIQSLSRAIDRQGEELLRSRLREILEPLIQSHHPRARKEEISSLLRFVGVWTDPANLLPPKVLAEAELRCGNDMKTLPVELPVAPLFEAGKSELIAERCMLRAEAMIEINGGYDGQVSERIEAFEREQEQKSF